MTPWSDIMTVMAPDRQAPPARRPGIGIVIDPGRLRQWRELRALSRDDLAARITALGLKDDHGRPLLLTKDAIAKIENPDPVRGRNPKPRSVRALCAGLGIVPGDLLPGSPPPDPYRPAGRRRNTEYLRGMTEFAIRHGIRYTKPSGGRSYNRPLREAYALAASGAAGEDVAAAIARARAEFPADPAPDASSGTGHLLAS